MQFRNREILINAGQKFCFAQSSGDSDLAPIRTFGEILRSLGSGSSPPLFGSSIFLSLMTSLFVLRSVTSLTIFSKVQTYLNILRHSNFSFRSAGRILVRQIDGRFNYFGSIFLRYFDFQKAEASPDIIRLE